MTTLAIEGISLDKILAKHAKDIEELKRRSDEASGLELTEEVSGLVKRLVVPQGDWGMSGH